LQEKFEVLKTAQEVIASGDVPAIVDYGIALDRQIKKDSRGLEEIKRVLREIGGTSVADRLTAKTVQVRGHMGEVTITYPADGPKLKPGVDLLASEAGIPEDVFQALFRKKTVVDFAEGFFEKLASLDVEDREMILGLIEVQRSLPRVTWPK
jgi:hypothetical protein